MLEWYGWSNDDTPGTANVPRDLQDPEWIVATRAYFKFQKMNDMFIGDLK